MTTAAEAASAKSEMAADLALGLATLSANQQITFTRYVKFVNPFDGFVFWLLDSPLKTLVVNGSLHYSTNTDQDEDQSAGVNQVVFTATEQVNDLNQVDATTATVYAYRVGDQTANVTVTATTGLMTGTVENLVNGNLSQAGVAFVSRALVADRDHLRFDFGAPTFINEAVFTQSASVSQGVWQLQGSWTTIGWLDIGSPFTLGGSTSQTLSQLAGNTKSFRYYQLVAVSGSSSAASNAQQFQFKVGSVPNEYLYIGEYGGLRFAFNSRGRYYKQADLHHYVGTAVLPALESQIVDDVAGFDTESEIVSNSLPLWLGMNTYIPPYPGFVCPIPLYSSYLVPANIPPPYGVVHISPDTTKAVLGTAYLDQTLGHWQLATEVVRVTLYGARNAEVMDFLDFINQYSYDWNYVGLRNPPIVRDEKRTQSEMTVLAMKKTIEFEISYQQHAARNLARQLIERALVTYLPQPLVAGDVAVSPTNV